ncbi:hypothetical protein [Escherichia coli]|uniref:hypothetical protein n=1 Tax=Escherichia coli TaxID=562 RepID=UPI000F4CA5E1
MNPSDAIEAIEKPLSSLPYSLSRHILEHLRLLTFPSESPATFPVCGGFVFFHREYMYESV